MLDRLRELIESSRRCKCGGDCELLKSLAEQILDTQLDKVDTERTIPYAVARL